MSNNMKQLQQKIMRRVYYSFAINALTSRLFIHTVLLAVGLYGVKVMVHVASFIKNLQSVQVGSVDSFLLNAFAHTDLFTLLSVGIVLFTLISFNYSIFTAPKTQRLQTA